MKNFKRLILCFLVMGCMGTFNTTKGMPAETLKELIAKGTFDVNKIGRNGLTPLMIVTLIKDNRSFDFLMGEKADVTTTDYLGQNLIHHAAIANNPYVILGCHANKTLMSVIHETPLMLAAKHGSMDALQTLLQDDTVKLKINDRDKNGNPAFLHALINGHFKIAEELLKTGTDALVYNAKNLNVLLIVFIFILKNPSEEQICIEFLTYFIRNVEINPKYINATNAENGWTPLHYAAHLKSDYLVNLLLNKGSNPSTQDHDGFIPLVIAVKMVQGKVPLQYETLEKLQPCANPQFSFLTRIKNMPQSLIKGTQSLLKKRRTPTNPIPEAPKSKHPHQETEEAAASTSEAPAAKEQK